MAKKKAQWLEGSNLSLILAALAGIAEGASDKDVKKVPKALEELKERFEADEAQPDVMGLLAKASQKVVEANGLIDQAGALYQEDLESAGVIEEVAQASEEDEAPVKKKGKKSKKNKKKVVEEVEEDEESSEVENGDPEADELDYASMTKKDLKALAKERGFKVGKKASKEEIIAILEG